MMAQVVRVLGPWQPMVVRRGLSRDDWRYYGKLFCRLLREITEERDALRARKEGGDDADGA